MIDLRTQIHQKLKRLEKVNELIKALDEERTELEKDLRSLSLMLRVSQGRRITIDTRYGLVEKVKK